MKGKLIVLGLVAIAAAAYAATDKLKLRLGTIGNGAVAKWISVPQGQGGADHRIYLAKNVPTTEFEAAGVDVQGIAGTSAGALNTLGYTLEGGTQGAGSPRWNIYLGPTGGDITSVIFLGPAFDTNNNGTYEDNEIEAQILAQGGSLTDEVKYLQIIVDEQGFAVIDDVTIQVGGTTTVFSGPGSSN
jgi:hypothetical protein